MNYAEQEFFDAYDALTTIISENEFQSYAHRFIRSYYVDYEYTHNNVSIFMKLNEAELRCEMLYYDLKMKKVTKTFAFRFTICKVYYEWLGHFTKLMFKESILCEEKYGKIAVSSDTIDLVERSMHKLESGDDEYQWR